MKKMNRVSNFCVLFILFFSAASAQTDTSKTYFNINPKFSFGSTQISPEYFNRQPPYLNFINDSSFIWLRIRLQFDVDPMKNNLQTNILNPLSQQYSALQSMKELKYILGMIKTGTVGYLAYLHLKKYGFLKGK